MSEKVMKVVFAFSAMFSVAAVAVICIFLLYNGVPAMREIGFFEFIGGKSWKPTEGQFGIFPMIVGKRLYDRRSHNTGSSRGSALRSIHDMVLSGKYIQVFQTCCRSARQAYHL